MAHEIFISYSTRDDRIAGAVCQALESSGIPCWIAPRDIPAGAEWDEALLVAIEQCNMVLLLLSSQANKSEHVKRELLFAVNCHRDIVSLRTEDIKPSRKLEYALGTHQWVDGFPPPLDQHLKKLAADLRLRLIKLKSTSPEARILSPGAGASWGLGARHEIRWEVHLASERVVERLKLSLCQGTREVEVLADSAAGFPVAATQLTWTAPSALPPGKDYQLRLEVTDDERQMGSALASFSLHAPGPVPAEVKEAPVVPQTPPPTAPPSQPPKEPKTPSVSPRATKDDLPLPFLPLGPRIVYLSVVIFAAFVGIAGGIHEGHEKWKEPAHPGLQVPVGWGTRPTMVPQPEMPAPASTQPRTTTDIAVRAVTGLGVGALRGGGMGAVMGFFWWAVFLLAGKVHRRPMELVFDAWNPFFQLQLGTASLVAGLVVLANGIEKWQMAFGIGTGLGFAVAIGSLFFPDANQKRQEAILGQGTAKTGG